MASHGMVKTSTGGYIRKNGRAAGEICIELVDLLHLELFTWSASPFIYLFCNGSTVKTDCKKSPLSAFDNFTGCLSHDHADSHSGARSWQHIFALISFLRTARYRIWLVAWLSMTK